MYKYFKSLWAPFRAIRISSHFVKTKWELICTSDSYRIERGFAFKNSFTLFKTTGIF